MTPKAAPTRGVIMGAPLVHVLWVTSGLCSGLCSGLWAFSREAVPINKSDTSINRTAVFIFSPRLILVAQWQFPVLLLINLHVVVDSVVRRNRVISAADAVQSTFING